MTGPHGARVYVYLTTDPLNIIAMTSSLSQAQVVDTSRSDWGLKLDSARTVPDSLDQRDLFTLENHFSHSTERIWTLSHKKEETTNYLNERII